MCSDFTVIDATSTIERAYRVRLRLKPAQERQLLRVFGARRHVWNWAIRRKDEAWRADGTKLNAVSLSREFTQLKAAPETAWCGAAARAVQSDAARLRQGVEQLLRRPDQAAPPQEVRHGDVSALHAGSAARPGRPR
jgi:uncharacterized protein YukE